MCVSLRNRRRLCPRISATVFRCTPVQVPPSEEEISPALLRNCKQPVPIRLAINQLAAMVENPQPIRNREEKGIRRTRLTPRKDWRATQESNLQPRTNPRGPGQTCLSWNTDIPPYSCRQPQIDRFLSRVIRKGLHRGLVDGGFGKRLHLGQQGYATNAPARPWPER